MKPLSIFILAIIFIFFFPAFTWAGTVGEGSYWVRQIEAAVLDEHGLPRGFVSPGEPFQIEVSFDVPYALPHQEVDVLVVVVGAERELYRMRETITFEEGWGSVLVPLLYEINGSETLTVEAYIYTQMGHEKRVGAVSVPVVDAPIVLPPDKFLKP